MGLTALGVVGVVLCCLTATQAATTLQLIGQTAFTTGPGTEQVAYDDKSKVAYLIGSKQLYVIDMSPEALLDNGQPATTPKALKVLQTKNLSTTVNDVSFCGGYLAISANGIRKTDPGTVTIFNRYLRGASLQGSANAKDAALPTKDSAAAATSTTADSDATIVRGSLTYRRVAPNRRRPGSLEQLAQFTVGALPDQLTFSKDCKTILVSNEGEPENYLAPAGGLDKDPEGSVSVINLFFCDDHGYDKQGYGPRHEHDYGRDHGYAMNNKEAGLAPDKQEGAVAADKEDSKKAAAAGAKKGGHKRLDSRRSKTGKSDPEKPEDKSDKKDDSDYGRDDDTPYSPKGEYPREDTPYMPKDKYPQEDNSLYNSKLEPSRDREYYPEPRPHYEEPRYDELHGQIPGCKGNEIYGIVRTANFKAWNDKKAALMADNVKFTGVNATVAQDLEPEYTTFTADEKFAFVSLQENNAVAVVDVEKAEIRSIHGLGFKDHNLPANKFDPSDLDNSTVAPRGPAAKINNWPVFGMYQPDEIASYSYKGDYYVVTANEGDARSYQGLVEERRVGQSGVSDKLDPVAFPNAAALINPAALGRLTSLALSYPVNPDTNTGPWFPYEPYSDPAATGKFSKLFSFGARSFSIWRLNDPSYNNPSTATLEQVFDSGSQLEDVSNEKLIEIYNSELGLTAEFDKRSDNKGPEPEGLSIGPCNEHYYTARPYYGDYRRPDREYPRYGREYPEEQEHRGRTCLYLGTERLGVMFVYDITNPYKPVFQSFARPPTSGGASLAAPEGVTYARYNFGPRSFGMVLVAYEADPDKPQIPAGLGVFKVVDG